MLHQLFPQRCSLSAFLDIICTGQTIHHPAERRCCNVSSCNPVVTKAYQALTPFSIKAFKAAC